MKSGRSEDAVSLFILASNGILKKFISFWKIWASQNTVVVKVFEQLYPSSIIE